MKVPVTALAWVACGLLATLMASSLASAQEPANGVESTFEVRKIVDVPYYQGPDADPVKHKLDLYLPKNEKDFPVIFFLHGGAWRLEPHRCGRGDKTPSPSLPDR